MPYKTFLAACFFMLLAACRPQGPAVELGGEYYRVEIADTDAKRQKGLMFRQNLPADHGMLFIFPRQAPRAFWMKNTRIPLDILYFDRDLKLVDQQRNVPPCHQQNCPSYPSTKPARFVLELNAGEAQRLGLKNGDSLRLYGIDSDVRQ
jgi:uncharacterized membrane protein (UPF0127 family)